MLAVIDPGLAVVIVALISAIVAPTWLQVLANNRREKERDERDKLLATRLDGFDKAMNNVGEGEPSLIQEVKTMRADVDEIKRHSSWDRHVLEAVARRVGVSVEPYDDWKVKVAAQEKEDAA